MNIKIVLEENGKLPVFKREGDACLDCYSAEDVTIEYGKRKLVNLGFKIAIPKGYEGVIRPRSGLTSHGTDNGIGTIDSNYRGVVKACIINNDEDEKPIEIKIGDRICQLAIRKTEEVELEVVSELDETERGENGFGSSGVR